MANGKRLDGGGLQRALSKLKSYIDTLVGGKQDTLVSGTSIKTVNNTSVLGSGNIDTVPPIATDGVAGLVKTNSAESVTLDANGVLKVGGRLGQFSDQEIPDGGLYYPLTIQPEKVQKNCLLISEATGLTVSKSRIFALFAGAGVTLKKTAAAGATTFEVSNTFANRFICAAARGGYATIEEATAGEIMVKVTKVATANAPNTDLVPYSGANESGNNIIITTDAPLSTTESVSKLRLYGSMTTDSSVFIGQGVGSGGANAGKLMMLGQSQLSLNGNSILIGNGMFNSQNRVILVGASHINYVQGACMTGEGHDSTNGTKVGLTAHGKYSVIGANTVFALGNGTANTARSNIFEVADNAGQTEVIMKSPSGYAFKLTVADDGTLSTTAVT